MKILGCVLAVVGLLILIYGGFTYNRKRTILDLGAIKATATERHTTPISPILGGLALLGGIVLVVVPRKRPAA
jgi:drug/metabolite transporter (DMT)-like permease